MSTVSYWGARVRYHSGTESNDGWLPASAVNYWEEGYQEIPVTDNIIFHNLKAKLESEEPALTSECCIYRVPPDIRKLNEEAYTPKVISIGPYHHGSKQLQNMERHKIRFLNTFLLRTGANLEDFIHCVKQEEPTVRRCYDEPVQFDRDDLAQVVLVDSCFIIELFWTYKNCRLDPILKTPWFTTTLASDLILLENQVPFFVIEKLYHLAFQSQLTEGTHEYQSILELTFNYFNDHHKIQRAPETTALTNLRHFTDLIRISHLPPPNRQPTRLKKTASHLPYSLTELRESGMKFQVADKNVDLLDIQYHRGVLQIPFLRVEDSTEIVFRNLVALEQCHYPYDSYITDYVALMDFLINTGKDVEILVHGGIIENWLGDNDSVANLFNLIWKNVTQVNTNSSYLALCKELDAFHNDRCHKLKATLKRDYFNTPWKTAASIAGMILLLLSLVQTVFGVIGVYHGK